MTELNNPYQLANDPDFAARLALKRLLPRALETLSRARRHRSLEKSDLWINFRERLDRHWPRLFGLLLELYGHRFDFYYHLEEIIVTLGQAWLDRPDDMRVIDHHREHAPDWFESQNIVGGALYVDLFSENLGRLQDHVDYLRDLGLTYVHLMPLFAVRPGDNDGGYAISNYRSVDPRLGTIDDLGVLARKLRANGISLVVDFVFNHTADDHLWAQQALSGDEEYQEYYYMFPDRTMPDQYERTLREIFPTVRRGNFTWNDEMKKWVWTTFNSFQWDLNYSNPSVFRAMLGEMLFLANTGVEVLRLDAVAFIWKQMGTGCENLPGAHKLIQAFNCACRISAPSLVFKSEAIVHPDEVVRYISPEECQLSYNPTLMALCWESLATREVKLLSRTLQHRHKLPEDTAWCNYLRCHDDIGWTFDDGDAAALGINAYDHRQFLNAFYTGQFEGSFARGVPFQHNPENGDMRIAGTLASLAGLEQAIEAENPEWKEMALRRILLLHGIILSAGGIPLLYLGEEWGTLNDYDFVKDPAKAGDSRWIHRPRMRWDFLEELKDQASIRRRLFTSIQRLIAERKTLTAFAGNDLKVETTRNPHILGYTRRHEGALVHVFANFSERPQNLDGNLIRTIGLGRFFNDHVSDTTIGTEGDITLEPYQFLWLERD
jgi:amylosucrase